MSALIRPQPMSVSFSSAARSALDEYHGLRVHMLGIGGSGMSGLAALLLKLGAHVSGSDKRMSLALARLMQGGAKITTLETADMFPADAKLIIASAAIPANHPELLEAQRRGIRVVKYAQMLGTLMEHFDGVAISGTHGKTTTTAGLAFLLRRAGLDPNFVVGGAVEQLGGGSGAGDGPHFVAEACEFDRSFLNLRPRYAAILNIEEDHLDCYPNLDAIVQAFADFAALVPNDGLLVLNAQDEHCRRLARMVNKRFETFGEADDSTWQAADLSALDGRYSFTVLHRGQPLGRATLGLSGRHNVWNALAITALAYHCGVEWPAIKQALQEFRGAKRRLELRGEFNGVRIVDDYGHHPTEVRATLAAARERFQPKRLWCVFQPHQYSRTRRLLDDFAHSFEHADFVILPEIYAARDTHEDRAAVCAADLANRIRANGVDTLHIPELDEITDYLVSEVQAGDLVLTMGAGTIGSVADELVQRLGGDLPG